MKLVSIMVPTRKRVKYVKEFMGKFELFTNNPKKVEFIFRIDKDDLETQEFFKINSDNKLYKMKCFGFDSMVFIGDQLGGYKDLSTFYNDVYSYTTGKWLWFYNDDAYICTKNWDKILEKTEYNQVLLPWQKHHEEWSGIVIIPRTFAEHLGYATPGASDGYWINVAKSLNILKEIDIEHVHREQTKEKAEGETRTATRNIVLYDQEFMNSAKLYEESVMEALSMKISKFLRGDKK